MAKILSVDTTGKISRANLFCTDGRHEAYMEIDNGKSHSYNVMSLIKNLCSKHKIKLEDIERALVVNGPGSFTGIRIGMAVVKGLFFGEEKVCAQMSSLEHIAREYLYTNKLTKSCTVYSLIDAKNHQIYIGKYYFMENGDLKTVYEKAGDLFDMIEEVIHGMQKDEKIVFAIEEGYEEIMEEVKSHVSLAQKSNEILYEHIILKLAGSIHKILEMERNEESYITPEEILPNYLKKTQAQKMWEEKNK